MQNVPNSASAQSRTILLPGQLVRRTGFAAMALLGLFALVTPATAFADVITTFSVSGAFDWGGPVTFDAGSTITIDTTTGLATDAALSLNVGGIASDLIVTGAPGVYNAPTDYFWFVGGFTPVITCLPCELDLQNTSGTGFVGFSGGDLTGGLFCDHCAFGPPSPTPDNNTTAIVLIPENEAPEPASLALLSMALVSLGAARRRKMA